MAVQLPEGKQSFTTATGAPGVGYKLYTYVPGTSTPKDTYTTSTAGVANTNPVIADARGEMSVYWIGTYDAVLKDAADVTIWGPERVETPSVLIDAGDALIRSDLANTASASLGDFLLGVKRTFTNAVATTEHAVHEAQSINAVAYAGMSTAGSAAANTTALGIAIAAAVAIGGGTVEIPAGSYALTAGTNWAAAGITLRGIGGPAVLTFAAAGNAFVVDSGGSGTVIYGMILENLRIVGNAATTVGFYSRGMVHMTVRNVEVRECSTKAFHILHGVSNYYESCVISTNRAAQTTKPAIGWDLDNAGAGYYTANCTFDNCVAEGFTGTGLALTDASGNLWCGGTFEGMTGKGIDILSDECRRNHFINVWCEANTVNDVIVKGVANQFTGCNFQSSTSGKGVDITTGTGTVFVGGFAREVNLGASSGNTHFTATGFSDNGALGITGTGTFTRVGCTRLNTSAVITSKYPDVLGDVSTWTPTATQSGAVALTVNNAESVVEGRFAKLSAKVTFTAAGTAGNQIIIAGIPSALAVKASWVTNNIPVGVFWFNDQSVGLYSGVLVPLTSTTFGLYANGNASAVGITPNFAIANTDVMYMALDYPFA